MIRITYLSEQSSPFSPSELLALLKQCHDNNPRRGLTGMLLYGNGTFLQTIEGEAADVDALVGKIATDPRHRGFRVLSRETVSERLHEGWSMGFERLIEDNLREAPGLREFMLRDFNPDYLSTHAEVVENLLQRHRTKHWDPLLRELDARDAFINELRTALEGARQRNEMSALLLESIIEAAGKGSLDAGHLQLCRSMLGSLRSRN